MTKHRAEACTPPPRLNTQLQQQLVWNVFDWHNQALKQDSEEHFSFVTDGVSHELFTPAHRSLKTHELCPHWQTNRDWSSPQISAMLGKLTRLSRNLQACFLPITHSSIQKAE